MRQEDCQTLQLQQKSMTNRHFSWWPCVVPKLFSSLVGRTLQSLQAQKWCLHSSNIGQIMDHAWNFVHLKRFRPWTLYLCFAFSIACFIQSMKPQFINPFFDFQLPVYDMSWCLLQHDISFLFTLHCLIIVIGGKTSKESLHLCLQHHWITSAEKLSSLTRTISEPAKRK